MSKEENVSESELQDMFRKLGADGCAKAWANVKRAYDFYPKASVCGRCGAKKGCCGCGYFPHLGSDVLYQLSRLHAQNVSHMVRMGLSTWDILTGSGRSHEGCSRCHCLPC